MWYRVESFWRHIARCILGVSMRAPNRGVYGDLGWLPFWVRAAHQATAMWTRITEMSSSAVVRKAMQVQRQLVQDGKDCWLRRFKDTLHRTSTCGIDKWNAWMDNVDFSVICSRTEGYASGKFRLVRWEDDCLKVYHEVAVSEWQYEVTRIDSKHGKGRNKLRTYTLFEQEWGYEPYISHINNRDRRVLLSKFRLGICPLRIETGRYENSGRNSKGIPEQDRKCECCTLDKVEDEYHFLLQCPAYSERRTCLLHIVQAKLGFSNEVIHQASSERGEVFCNIMQSIDKDIINAVASYIWDAFKLREQLHACRSEPSD